MKFRRQGKNPETPESREEIREIAEALSLYRSAMCHLAERAQLRPFAAEGRFRRFPLRLLLAPALTAAVAAGIFFPVYSYSHHHVVATTRPVKTTRQNPAAPAIVDDTALMNQIDSELSQDVPDALEPLADMSDQTATTSSEKKNVTHE